MDKQNPAFRKYLAQRVDLLGAVRLPNNAFHANAGTEVTTDILFLQKRERMMEVEPEWVHLGRTENGIPINSYFVDNPHMVLGEMAYDDSMYGNQSDTTCKPFSRPEVLTFEQDVEKRFGAFRERFAQDPKQKLFIERIEKSMLAQGNYDVSFLNQGVYKSNGGLTYINKLFDDNLLPFLSTLAATIETKPDKSNLSLSEMLKEATGHLPEGMLLKTVDVDIDMMVTTNEESILADPSVRNFSYSVADGDIYYRENSVMNKQKLPEIAVSRLKGLIQLRDCTRELIEYQLEEYGDSEIKQKQAELSTLYDDFTTKYGLINSRANNLAFSKDSAYFLLCSLEVLDENQQLERKADMFTKRTIKKKAVVTSVDTASEALTLSVAEKASVDINYMCGLTGFSEEKLIKDLEGVIFRDFNGIVPEDVSKVFFDINKFGFVTASEYLSGNVWDKLRQVKALAEILPPEQAKAMAPNIEALTATQPKDLTASEIDVRLGATWIDKKYINDFLFELLQPPRYRRGSIHVNYLNHTAAWNIEGKSVDSSVLANVTYGTNRINAYKIIEDTLNLKDVRIMDTVMDSDGKERRVLNKKETILAQQKQDSIKQAFRDWIFKDPNRRELLVREYNERLNSIRPREYDGRHINFSGINPAICLRPHQLNAIAHILYGGNTLLAHEVGAGKSFEMIAAAMESKRLGLAQKSLMVVPNHIIEQMASEFLHLYPSANILVSTKKDFETQNRKKFCSRIATGDYDAVRPDRAF